jgi:lipopolysaccharide/colanic/teichoic acid biosynthesis glycosyltransferase
VPRRGTKPPESAGSPIASFAAEQPVEAAVSVQERFAGAEEARLIAEPFVLAPPARPAAAAPARARLLYPAFKRALDLSVALALLVATAPLLLALALWIRLDSKGPALFRQTRLGLGGKPFAILKFRTMTVLEDGERVVQAAPGDARITRAGCLLRAASLDELPQLFNVIRGEMSLVGPRPHAVAHDALYSRLIPDYDGRQAVKPGVTGWAQVNGYRGGTPTVDLMQRRVAHDLWYARHASLALDLVILARTPIEILRARNAY